MRYKSIEDFIKDAKPSGHNPNMPDYSKDPISIEMRARALEFLKKAGIPEGFKHKNKK
jgi:hypothetical protein